MLGNFSWVSFSFFFHEHYQFQTVWIPIRIDILSVLIWGQTVCKGNQPLQARNLSTSGNFCMWCANNLCKQLGQNKYGKFKTDYSFYPYPTYSVDLENRLYFLPPPPPPPPYSVTLENRLYFLPQTPIIQSLI